MKKKTIKYVGFYDFPDNSHNRVFCLAAVNKMDYVCSAIVRAGCRVEIISPCWMGKNSGKSWERQNTVVVDDNISVTFCPSWRAGNKIAGYGKIMFSLTWLFLYLLMNTEKGEKVLVYHTPWLSVPVRAAKSLKGFKLVLDVGEIYREVWRNNRAYKLLSGMEKSLIEAAAGLIVSSETLKERFKDKQSIVLYGGYLTDDMAGDREKKERKEIGLVYAGSIEDTRGGAYNAVRVMKYLPDYYNLSIIGYGTPDAVNKLNNLIRDTGMDSGRCQYHGVKTGKEYSEFLRDCDIALNPQYQGTYMDTAFPTKVLSYLSHNLRVVSTRVKNVELSVLVPLITFSADDSPESVADAVMSVDLSNPYDSITVIKKLDMQFVEDIGKLLE